MCAAERLPLDPRTAETCRGPAGADRQTDRHGDTTHRAGRHRAACSSVRAGSEPQARQILLTPSHQDFSQRIKPGLAEMPVAGLTSKPYQLHHQGWLSIPFLKKQHFILSSINCSFWEDRREDFCKAEITPPNTRGMLPMKPREVLRGRAKVTQFIRQP